MRNKVKAFSFVQLYTDELPIFVQNPTLKEHKPFDELFEMGEEGDKIMSAIYRIYDPKSTYHITIPDEDERIQDVNENFLLDKNFDWKPYKDYIETYKKECISELQKRLLSFKSDLDGMQMYQQSLSWSDENDRGEKVQLIKEHKEFLLDYKEVLEKAEAEVIEMQNEANYIFSWLEQKALDLKN